MKIDELLRILAEARVTMGDAEVVLICENKRGEVLETDMAIADARVNGRTVLAFILTDIDSPASAMQ